LGEQRAKMFKTIIKLVIIAAIAHAGIRIVPVFWQYANFKDRLAETARYGIRRSNEQLTAKSMKIAKELEVPLESAITVNKTGDQMVVIDTEYTAQLEYLPKKYYPWKFVIHVEEVPQRYDAYMP
jgi:hypothetical protein